MEKLVKGGLLGGLVLFIWGMIAWTVLPWHKMHMMKFSNEKRVAEVMKDNAPMSGLYFLPNMMNLRSDSADMKESKEMMEQGPVVFASVVLEGRSPSMAIPIAKGLILKIVVAFLVTWLLLHTKLSYHKKVGFVTMVGVIIALMGTLPYWIWFGFPGGFTVGCMFEIVLGWFFAGLAIGKVSR